ncbi:type III-B CRISPR module-associated Cmr3 family protein [Saccharopolyspora sp. TS4A08]|uniref:Type III-B CRISPR module-associated Cmr3 family protein n=1 Tax=Saccharopolyspora ipomoeae TaxID=3042027 RepID=A0ABT6PNM4_9PSEU|nr:type III-B CRISPR module-associated Cmr3 family protein [Saccharopolyspora sp. TS4A08]MDI2029512.1 type III-B CRISPR module-associated Cmr3 family protein [Saccharopolyspora sp. TS4A08]
MSDYVKVNIKLDEPVAPVKYARPDYRQEVYDHIPGSVLRGAIAAVWRQKGIDPTSEKFLDVFEGEGSFGPLHSSQSLPIPISVHLHKHVPLEDCTLSWDAADPEEVHPERCSHCGSEYEASKGQAHGSVSITSRTMTRLDTNGVAEDGYLFSQQELDAGLQLEGWLYGPAVGALTDDAVRVKELLLGSRRGVRGAATISFERGTRATAVQASGNEVILRLASPGLFVDEFGMPTEIPDLEEIRSVLGMKEITLVDYWSRWTDAGGWHAASGLPKPTERAVAAGSTYRLRFEAAVPKPAREELAARGVGLRRREGFGALYKYNPESFRTMGAR